MQRSSVDLPEPDGPIKATAEPLGTANDMPLRTCSGPKAFHRSRTSIMALSCGAGMAQSDFWRRRSTTWAPSVKGKRMAKYINATVV